MKTVAEYVSWILLCFNCYCFYFLEFKKMV